MQGSIEMGRTSDNRIVPCPGDAAIPRSLPVPHPFRIRCRERCPFSMAPYPPGAGRDAGVADEAGSSEGVGVLHGNIVWHMSLHRGISVFTRLR